MSEALPPGAPGLPRRPLGTTGLPVSPLGFGCYRVDDATPEHRAALEAALRSGCNLIDTSTNYTDGGSERLVGEVLARAGHDGLPPRDGVVAVSKIGYVQGANLRLALERERAGTPFPEMVRYMDGCWHCIHPEFLRDQLARSRARLRLERLDVCLLHNPEYFLSDAAHRRAGGPLRGEDLERLREEFYRRVTAAFAFFEEAVRQGVIRFYGVSSNTAVADPGDPEQTSVSRMLRAAEAAGGTGHHFRVLQVPMNLIESGGALVPNTGAHGDRTALQAAAEGGLAVLINRPLNAIVGHRLLRLADPPPSFASSGRPGETASAAVARVIDPLFPEARRSESLSRKALWTVASTPGVTCVLVGMRQASYVEDAMGIAAWPPLPDPLAIYRAFT
jgi:hypothetical protein